MNIMFFLLMSLMSTGQEEISIRVVKTDINSHTDMCFGLELTSNATQGVELASQNYRIFYNSENLDFDEESLRLALSNDVYQLRLVQQKDGVNAQGIGQLPFEDDLGFINFSVVMTNSASDGTTLAEESNWIRVAEMCFDIKDKTKPKHLVLARNELTSEYGRAFIELSVSDNGDVRAANIQTYRDYSEN